ncbi:3-hydroxyacyl-CoA dehydrogenase family protein [Candidatus Methanoperedens nitratireducens]|uniref:Putative 3-hydroxyacyl-CoA dehydrogenase n=1 Tax=Candidatus Methanoperedens nitratireducens TaxID=1392998 RepID=A0A284VIP8_9EURY|nr:3-hydroxyacyl-CoA dehydrogenase family protein [Candidatus Methanoperedens nitroreducens]SNQ59155.1 putative 3-hydroxyacyl-CoA dehydrogenase [Candidatus Methanoperedens nitroreducens]
MEIKPINTVCIFGAGFMGAQIGLQSASHGYATWIVGHSEKSLKQASDSFVQELETRVKKQQITTNETKAILSRIHLTRDIKECADSVDLVIEAVPEKLDIKREVFAQLDKICPSHTILATNSSSIRISAIEDATNRPDKVLNMHFYPPIWERPMVELMRGTRTSDETIESVREFARNIGLTPLPVLKESIGFLFNRVWRAIKKECLHIVDNGVATYEDVDRAWMIFTGMKIGPFGLMDLVGLDVVRDIELEYYHESGDGSDYPPRLLLDRIEKGELGVKTGKGFYTYPDPAFEQPGWLRGSKE